MMVWWLLNAIPIIDPDHDFALTSESPIFSTCELALVFFYHYLNEFSASLLPLGLIKRTYMTLWKALRKTTSASEICARMEAQPMRPWPSCLGCLIPISAKMVFL